MTWQIDPSHSRIYFSARHMMVARVRGEFRRFEGAIDFNEERPTETTVDITIDVNSLDTGETGRDEHLRSADFFEVADYPVARFVSKRVEQRGADHGRLIGDLTIKDVTHELVIDVEYIGQNTDPWGNVKAGFSGTATINRKDWGLNWNVALEAGGWLVSEKINLELELELVKVAETEPVLVV
jgi:polyisoprenoid-binding protein YceI